MAVAVIGIDHDNRVALRPEAKAVKVGGSDWLTPAGVGGREHAAPFGTLGWSTSESVPAHRRRSRATTGAGLLPPVPAFRRRCPLPVCADHQCPRGSAAASPRSGSAPPGAHAAAADCRCTPSQRPTFMALSTRHKRHRPERRSVPLPQHAYVAPFVTDQGDLLRDDHSNAMEFLTTARSSTGAVVPRRYSRFRKL